MRNLIAEESMKHQWCTHREFKAYPDGQQRWDRAYQYLLQWTGNESAATENQPQEAEDENCSVCASIDLTAGAGTDDRTTAGTLTGALGSAGVSTGRGGHFS